MSSESFVTEVNKHGLRVIPWVFRARRLFFSYLYCMKQPFYQNEDHQNKTSFLLLAVPPVDQTGQSGRR